MHKSFMHLVLYSKGSFNISVSNNSKLDLYSVLPYGKISHDLYTNEVTVIQAVNKLHSKQKTMALLLRFR